MSLRVLGYNDVPWDRARQMTDRFLKIFIPAGLSYSSDIPLETMTFEQLIFAQIRNSIVVLPDACDIMRKDSLLLSKIIVYCHSAF